MPKVKVKEVTSKYFQSMQQSSSINDSDDFLPKKVKKKTENKCVTRKNIKTETKKRRVKSKSDKKLSCNNLVQFTKDFQTVCNEGGIDVDPDQLQLAIALSQSLQESQSGSTSSKETIDDYNSLNYQQNFVKIRKTLEQFGFTVQSAEFLENEILRKNKRLKKYSYPLINKSFDEKQQIIANKFSQILLEDVNIISRKPTQKQLYNFTSELLKESFCDKACSFIKSALSFKNLSNESTSYHVLSLFEPSASKVGCLLKDWSSIPGRDKSPERVHSSPDFRTNILFENNLDTLLSGTVDEVENAMADKCAFVDANEEENKMFNKDRKDDINIKRNITCQSPDLFDDSFDDYNENVGDTMKSNSEELCNKAPYDDSNHFKQTKILQNINEPNVVNDSNVIIIEDEKLSKKVEERNDNSLSENLITDIEIVNSMENDKKIDSLDDIVHYENYNESFINNSNNESSLSGKSDEIIYESELRRINSSNEINNRNEENVCEEIDLTQSDEEKYSQQKTYKNLEDQISENNLNSSEQDNGIFILSDDELDYSVSVPLKTRPNISIVTENNDLLKTEVFQSTSYFSTENLVSDALLKNTSESSILCEPSCSLNIAAENENMKSNSKWYSSSIFDSISSTSILHKTKNDFNDFDRAIEREKSVIIQTEKESYENSSLLQKTFNDTVESSEMTPDSKYILKTKNVTPLTDYNSMETPKLVKELSKYGLKPLKRKRAVQILEHIYEQIHPLVDSNDLENKMKRRKVIASPMNQSQNVTKNDNLTKPSTVCIFSINSDIYAKTGETIQIKKLFCDDEELFFPSKKKSKVHDCTVPLNIVFHNYLSTRSLLQDAILKYEPIDIERIHHDLKEIGHIFKPKDLMDFLDKKCITIKTTFKKHTSKKQNYDQNQSKI